MRRRCSAVTLLEMIVVVAVIAILFAIAVPLYTRSKMVANEASAISSLRTIFTSQSIYCRTKGEYGDLPGLTAAKTIDAALGTGVKTGYKYEVTVDSSQTWHAEAVPEVKGTTGERSYYVDESGLIRGTDTGDALFKPRAVAVAWPPVQ